MNGSLADHDDLVEALDALLGFDKHCQAPMVLTQNLTAGAQRCGWDGQDNAIAWASRRVDSYHRAITGGR